METIEVSTTVRVPPSEAYAFLQDFEGYSEYSKYVKGVQADGDGSQGTEYEIRFGWWKLSYGVHTAVVGATPPERIQWRVLSDVDAHGSWEIELATEDGTEAAEVTLVVTYDPDSAKHASLDLPTFVSLDWVVDKVVGLIEEEGRRVTERVVTDLEGEPRPVTLTVRHRESG